MSNVKTKFQCRLTFAQQRLSKAAEATYLVDRRGANEDATQQIVRAAGADGDADVG